MKEIPVDVVTQHPQIIESIYFCLELLLVCLCSLFNPGIETSLWIMSYYKSEIDFYSNSEIDFNDVIRL